MDVSVNTTSSTPSIDTYVEMLISTSASKSVRSGSIRRDDRDDLEQDLRIAVLSSIAGYDPTKASWHTYANGVVHHTLQMHLRGRHAACRHPARCRSLVIRQTADDHEATIDVLDERQHDEQRAGEFFEDVQAAVARMPDEQRTVALLLMTSSPGAAQQQLGWSKARYYQVRDQIRAALEDAECAPA